MAHYMLCVRAPPPPDPSLLERRPCIIYVGYTKTALHIMAYMYHCCRGFKLSNTTWRNLRVWLEKQTKTINIYSTGTSFSTCLLLLVFDFMHQMPFTNHLVKWHIPKQTGLGYGRLLHGEAVAIGMHMAVDMSCRMGWIDKDLVDRTVRLMLKAKLPVELPKGGGMNMEKFLDVSLFYFHIHVYIVLFIYWGFER